MAVDKPWQPKQFACNWCGARIFRAGVCSCARHCSEACHAAEAAANEGDKELQEQGVECPVCHEMFKTKFALVGHMKRHKAQTDDSGENCEAISDD